MEGDSSCFLALLERGALSEAECRGIAWRTVGTLEIVSIPSSMNSSVSNTHIPQLVLLELVSVLFNFWGWPLNVLGGHILEGDIGTMDFLFFWPFLSSRTSLPFDLNALFPPRSLTTSLSAGLSQQLCLDAQALSSL